MTPLDYCKQKVAHSGSNFVISFRFLPKAKREAMLVLYAFCREVDDVVDTCSDPNVAQTTLNWWRGQLAAVYDGQPDHPVCQALQPIVAAFELPQSEFSAIIDGMQMDLQQARYGTFAELSTYCQRVAGAVGRLSVRVFGFTDPKTLDFADQLGLALQMTNIIRDVGEDARLGRIYLPVTELQQFNVPAQNITGCVGGPEFADLMRFQVERAKGLYQTALATLPAADAKAQKTGLIMAAVYHALLLEIDADGPENVLRHKIKLPGLRKARIALKVWLSGFKP
ncbi:MAG: presqualene diphosphate synthase HpnD [Neisseriaceae bacterium]|nr:presqualene diphosphate synthase HpnD [Neisseriaceae bacterium]MBP6863281.1 presqualene diphosphate synthase HpnD [Neisseriaceae bacterium]